MSSTIEFLILQTITYKQKQKMRSKPLPRRQEQKPLHVQRETWYQHQCSSMDLQPINSEIFLDEKKT
jgi:hypothetical protein